MTSRCDCPPDDCRARVARCLAGDREAGAELCRKFEPLVMALVVRILGPERRDEWEDARQDVFLHLLQKLDRWQGQCPFCKWLAVVTARRVLDLRRLEAPLLLPDPDRLPAPPPGDVDRELIEQARRELRTLPEDWQKAWQMSLDGVNHEEIAGRLGKSRRSIQYWLAAVRERLARLWEGEKGPAG